MKSQAVLWSLPQSLCHSQKVSPPPLPKSQMAINKVSVAVENRQEGGSNPSQPGTSLVDPLSTLPTGRTSPLCNVVSQSAPTLLMQECCV